MLPSAPTEAPAASAPRERDQIPDQYKWDLARIYSDWDAWHAAYRELDQKISEFGALQGTLAQGGDVLLGR
jgi:oligoendopeptidase F